MLDLVADLTCLNVILLNHLPFEPLFQVMNEGKVFKHLLCQQKNPAMTSSTFFLFFQMTNTQKKLSNFCDSLFAFKLVHRCQISLMPYIVPEPFKLRGIINVGLSKIILSLFEWRMPRLKAP